MRIPTPPSTPAPAHMQDVHTKRRLTPPSRPSVADIIRSCLGPKAMLKMLLDPMGGIVLTNDGHAILREIEVSHPAAKSMIELSRTQDEEVGDGTTTVIILGGCGPTVEGDMCARITTDCPRSR